MRWCISMVLHSVKIRQTDRSNIRTTLVIAMVTACCLLFLLLIIIIIVFSLYVFFSRLLTLTLQSCSIIFQVIYSQCVKMTTDCLYLYNIMFNFCWFNRPIVRMRIHALIVWEDIDLSFDYIKRRKYEPTK